MNEVWSVQRAWAALRQDGEVTLSADEAVRARIARFLDVEALGFVSAKLSHEPWRDGVQIEGRVEALATRLCGASLDPFDEPVDTTFSLRLVPEGSVNAPTQEDEIVVSLEADDPPEVVSGDVVDLASLIVEALGLALDPYPRKPGTVFDYVDPLGTISPFASLKSSKLD